VSVWTTAGIIADGTFDDPENARIIYLAVGGLLLLAVGLGLGTWYWWRNAKVEHPALGPLEVMGSRRWWRSDFNDRRRQLDAARPPHDTDGDGVPDAADPVDLDLVMTRDDPQNFDDLLEPAAVGAVADADETASADEPVVADEAEAEAASEQEVAPESEPEPEAEQLALLDIDEAVPPRPAIITVDTAPKRPEAESEPEPEVKDSDPTPVPIDPLLRLQID
jgi:hypothetical protein